MGWDKGVDFESVLKLILKNRAYAREFVRPRLLRAINVALIQLVNGLRISEALECYYKFLITKERHITVRVRKSRDRYRVCIIPEIIDNTDIALTRNLRPVTVSSIKTIIYKRLGVNTHSLRYAFINKLLASGVDVATVSKIVAHKKLDTLLTYVQEKRAREELEGLVKNVDKEVRRLLKA
jgi:Phage integrase family.